MSEELPPYFKEKFSLFALQHKRWLTSSVAGLAGILVLIVSLQTSPKMQVYAMAEEALAKWEKSEDNISYAEMRKALKKAPALEKKYEAAIAQKLFERNHLSAALSIAHDALKQIETDAPFHAAYGETTLLIEEGEYQNALEKAVSLKEQMMDSCDFDRIIGDQPAGGTLLFAHNLLRIACLQKELNNRPGEKAAWEELEIFLNTKESVSHLVFNNFREKGLDLTHYIIERKKQL